MYFDSTTLTYVACSPCSLSRLSDILTTRLASPRLTVEANPIAKKLGWTYALLTALAGLLPLYDMALGMAVTTASFLVALSNATKILACRELGEEAIKAILIASVRSSGAFKTWLVMVSPAVVSAFIGVTIFISAGRYPNEMIYGALLGFLAFPPIVFLYSALAVAGVKRSIAAA